MLTGIFSPHANDHAIEHAIRNYPSLIIDCANAVNPHAFFPFPDEAAKNVFVVQAELLYTFRDVFKEVKTFAQQIPTKTIIVTSFQRLFNYQNAEENANIYDASWQRMKELAKEFDIIVAVHKSQEEMAKTYCDNITAH